MAALLAVRVDPAAAAHPAAVAAVREQTPTRIIRMPVTRLADLANNASTASVSQHAILVKNVSTALASFNLVPLLVRTHNNQPEQMSADVSPGAKINVLTLYAELVKSSIMKPVPVMLIRLAPVKKEAEKRFTT